MAKLLDANLIIRFLLKDNLIQAAAVKKLLSETTEDLIVTDLTIAEVVWVLQSVYKLPKQEVIEKVLSLLEINKLIVDYILLTNSLLIYKDHHISFVDAYLAAYSEQNKLEGIYSFDKDLDKIKSVKRFKP
ncbi:MAG: PIN domain-containing protein [Candidatus Daviesbacteria bacterium]|nr:PIN domain-containing protein [Candidatus Daviesbacteria bacterium]